MPDNASDPTNLKTQYAVQVASDLENNAKEQERIGSDIAALQSQLSELERDHSLLLTMQQALAADQPVAAADTSVKARLPRARGSKEVPAGKAARGAKGAATGSGTRQDKHSGEGRTAKERGTRRRASGTPTLREVVIALLAGNAEPRSAAEVTTALAETHPERETSPTVVRNTLEALVAKGQAHRSKQQKSVFYSAVGTTPATASAAASGTDQDGGSHPQSTAGAPGENSAD